MKTKEAIMTRWRPIAFGIVFAVVLSVLMALHHQTAGAESGSQDYRKKITIELTEDFYKALRNEGTTTYTTERQNEYLRQIAVSTKFMVETNLRIIEQQARMIELLEKQNSKK
jgi:hypothetical protein